ncbi:MAG: hypothetical protein AB4372_38290 [Xenococcus sp. (in: cyanobacteria)]
MTSKVVIDTLNQRIANLIEQWAAVNKEIDTESNYEKRLLLERRANDIWETVEKTETKLKQQEKTEAKPINNDLDITENLPEINFQTAIKILEEITKGYFKDLGMALFLLDNSYKMAGELLIYKIQEQLKHNMKHSRHFIVDASYLADYQESGLLERLAEYLKVYSKSEKDSREYNVTDIINNICNSLQHHSFIFIELKNWDSLPCPDKIITWFVKDFWIPLLQESKFKVQKRQLRRVYLVAVIDSLYCLKNDCLELPYYCDCQKDKFDEQKIVKLPLEIWTQEQIKKWIYDYTEVPEPKINAMSQEIYLATDGLPRLVIDLLQKKLLQ